jgi:hypothetical protein
MTIQRRDKARRRKEERGRPFRGRGERNRLRPVDLERRRALREPDDGNEDFTGLDSEGVTDGGDDLEALDHYKSTAPVNEMDRPLNLGELIPYSLAGMNREDD